MDRSRWSGSPSVAYDWETGAIRARARSAATEPAWIRKAAKAARQTPYATSTPKASDASVAQTNINEFIASCMFC